MAAQLKCGVSLTVQGLGKGTELKDNWLSASTPSEAIHSESLTQTTTNTEQALYIGDSTTPLALLIRAVTNDVKVDLNYTSATFRASIVILEGTSQLVVPAGDVYFMNNTTDELATIEYAYAGT